MEASSVTQNSSTGSDHNQDHDLNHDGIDSNPKISRGQEPEPEPEQEQAPEQEYELEQVREKEQAPEQEHELEQAPEKEKEQAQEQEHELEQAPEKEQAQEQEHELEQAPEKEQAQEQEQAPEKEQAQEQEQAPEKEQAQEQEHELEQALEQKKEQDEERVRRVLQVISTTGNFWDSWDKLKSMLSFQLKLVLSEYPEAKLTVDEQNALLGETYLDLVTRLDEELHCFIEGPPFTLQRICEILLAARSIYPKLSKLALALEKNLLVTSTLTVCTKPYPDMMSNPEPEKKSEESQSNSIQNGVEPLVGDGDEIMTQVDTNIEKMTIDMDALQEIVGPSEANSTATENS